MKTSNNKSRGFTLIELLVVITIIGILAMLAFQGKAQMDIMATKTISLNNLREILRAYNIYGEAISEDIEGEEMVEDDGDEVSYSKGSNHDWAAVLAADSQSMDTPALYMLDKDSIAKAINKSKNAKNIIDPDSDDDMPTVDSDFKESILCFNFFAGLREPDHLPNPPVGYTAGLKEDGKWSNKAPLKTSGGHIGFLDNSVKFYKRIKEEDFRQKDDKTTETQNLKEAVYGAALGHDGEDDLSGERGN
ncbi:MAG: type II secretion system protein [Opitutae bacterium]|jgi:prepilin-type N-terminal cleavage/methylation domain-containing protein|nr:type II secretion system protein [Opitutae bacterium]